MQEGRVQLIDRGQRHELPTKLLIADSIALVADSAEQLVRKFGR